MLSSWAAARSGRRARGSSPSAGAACWCSSLAASMGQGWRAAAGMLAPQIEAHDDAPLLELGLAGRELYTPARGGAQGHDRHRHRSLARGDRLGRRRRGGSGGAALEVRLAAPAQPPRRLARRRGGPGALALARPDRWRALGGPRGGTRAGEARRGAPRRRGAAGRSHRAGRRGGGGPAGGPGCRSGRSERQLCGRRRDRGGGCLVRVRRGRPPPARRGARARADGGACHGRRARGAASSTATAATWSREDDEAIAGSTMEYVGFRPEVTSAGLARLFAGVTALCPTLTTASVKRTWAGLRPVTPDGLPDHRRRAAAGRSLVCDRPRAERHPARRHHRPHRPPACSTASRPSRTSTRSRRRASGRGDRRMRESPTTERQRSVEQ